MEKVYLQQQEKLLKVFRDKSMVRSQRSQHIQIIDFQLPKFKMIFEGERG